MPLTGLSPMKGRPFPLKGLRAYSFAVVSRDKVPLN